MRTFARDQEKRLHVLQSTHSVFTGDKRLTDPYNLRQTVNPTLLFSSSPDTPFPTQAAPPGGDLEPGQLDVKQFEWHDEKLGVVFESQSMVSISDHQGVCHTLS